MVDVSFIEKCYDEWLKQNPDSSYYEFKLLCKMWIHMHETTYGKVYVDSDDMDEWYKKWYGERLHEPKEDTIPNTVNGVYGIFADSCRKRIANSVYGKSPKEMNDEGWCNGCDGDVKECIKNGKCGGNDEKDL